MHGRECCGKDMEAEGRGNEENIPSSFPSTRFTAPEHPPQLMLTLNLYVCSADILASCFPSSLPLSNANADVDGGGGGAC